MCRKVLALYDLCYDTPSRPSTCTSSRPVNSPHNDVYFGLQRCPATSPCPEDQMHPTIYLPLVARTCSNSCERELNPEYWAERQSLRRKEYNPFLDRMLCLGRDSRLYHVVTGECVAGEEQFGEEGDVDRGREAYVGMLPGVPWREGEGRVSPLEGSSRREGVNWTPALPPLDFGGSESRGRSETRRPQFVDQPTSPVQDCSASQMSRSSTWMNYRSHLRSLRGRLQDRGEGSPECSGERTSSPSWLGRRLVRSKTSKRCLVSHES